MHRILRPYFEPFKDVQEDWGRIIESSGRYYDMLHDIVTRLYTTMLE